MKIEAERRARLEGDAADSFLTGADLAWPSAERQLHDNWTNTMRSARLLTAALLGVMSAQASTGLVFRTAYRDVDWIRATWFGNDLVTLLLAVPLLLVGLVHTARGSIRGLLLWLGIVGYAAYNYAFYLFGAALNAFFPMYVVALVLAAAVLILALSQIDVTGVGDSFRPVVPTRLIGGALVLIAIGLATVWIAIWAAYVFAGRPTPVDPEAFKLVAALDLSSMVPVLGAGGILIARRMRWGVVISAIASIQGALYLLVLSVNSMVAMDRGLTNAPGELPIWGTLTIVTGAVALVVLAGVQSGGPKLRRGDRSDRAPSSLSEGTPHKQTL